MAVSRSEAALVRMESAAAERAGARARVQIRRSERAGARAPQADGRRPKRELGDHFHYEIYTETHPDVLSGRRACGADDALVRQLKARVNDAGISRADLYEFVGDGPGCLFRDKNAAYNLEYGLGERPTISLECLRRWLAVFGEELAVAFQASEGGWLTRALELRAEAAAYLGPPPPPGSPPPADEAEAASARLAELAAQADPRRPWALQVVPAPND